MGSEQPEGLRGGGGEEAAGQGKNFLCSQFSAGVEVSLNCYHADLESFFFFSFAIAWLRFQVCSFFSKKPENVVGNACSFLA